MVGLAGEVAGARSRVRHDAQTGSAALLPDPVEDAVEERALRGRQRSAERSAELVLTEDRARQRRVLEVVAGVAELVAKILEGAAVEVPRARLRHHVDRAAARLRELRRRERRLNAELLYGLDRRVNGDREGVSVGVVRAVEQKRVLRGARAVDRRIQRHRAARALLHVVMDVVAEAAELARDGAGPERDQRDHVPRRQRELLDLRVVHAVADGRRFGVDRRNRGGDLYRLGAAEGQADLLPRALAHLERQPGAVRLESLRANGQAVGAGRNLVEEVCAPRVAAGRALPGSRCLREDQLGVRHQRAGRIGHRSGQRGGSHLGVGTRARQNEKERCLHRAESSATLCSNESYRRMCAGTIANRLTVRSCRSSTSSP